MGKALTIGLVLSAVPAYSETFFSTKINGLSERGFQVILFARGNKRADLKCRQVKPYPVFNSPLLRFLALSLVLPIILMRAPRRVLRFWRSERAHQTHVIEIVRRLYINGHILACRLDWLHFGFASVAIDKEEIAGAMGAKMAASFRGYDINVYPLKNPGCYEKVWQRLDKVHAISNYLIQKAHQIGLPLTIPYQIITPAVRLQDHLKVDFHFREPLKIVTVARLSWIKGLEYAIQAMAILRSNGVKFNYSIIGDGQDYEKLVFEIDDLRLNGMVSLAGRLSHRETIEQVKDADLYLQPSLNEGFCNAVLEAQALGCLCIVSDVGALPENVVDGETGWLVPSRDPGRLAGAIEFVLRCPVEERIRISMNSRQRAESKFGIDDHLRQWERFYEDETINNPEVL